MELPGESSPAMEATLTTAPLAAFSAGAAALVQRNTPSRFTCTTVCHSSSVMRSSSVGVAGRGVDRHGAAAPGNGGGRGQADAGTAAGHERRLALQVVADHGSS